MYNPVLGGITSAIGGISPLVSKTLKDVVTNAKNTKKSIERSNPQKVKIYIAEIFFGVVIYNEEKF